MGRNKKIFLVQVKFTQSYPCQTTQNSIKKENKIGYYNKRKTFLFSADEELGWVNRGPPLKKSPAHKKKISPVAKKGSF